MSIKIFGLDLCPLELITGDNGKLSTTKIWMNIANLVLSVKVIMMKSIEWDVMAVYGSIVGGSYVAAKFISMKYAEAPEGANITVNQPEILNVAGDAKIKKRKRK